MLNSIDVIEGAYIQHALCCQGYSQDTHFSTYCHIALLKLPPSDYALVLNQAHFSN